MKKKRLTDATNLETLLRIVQSIPRPKAASIKQWFASIGYEKIQEIANPKLILIVYMRYGGSIVGV